MGNDTGLSIGGFVELIAPFKNDTKTYIFGRSLTNIGTYREYVKAYLRENSSIHSEMTFLVRQLSPTEKGLPIEVAKMISNLCNENSDFITGQTIHVNGGSYFS